MTNAKQTTTKATKTTEKKAPPPFILGKRPETVPGTVTIPMIEGDPVEVAVDFVYRTRKEFGELWDKISASAIQAGTFKDGEKASFEQLFERGNRINAKNALVYIKSWGLPDVELSETNLVQLFDEAPAAPGAFWEAYRAAMAEGRRGN